MLSFFEKNDYWSFVEKSFSLFDKLFSEIVQQEEDTNTDIFSEYYAEKNVWNSIILELGGIEDAKNLSLGQLLQEIALANKSPEPPTNAIRCFTIHASKGMEFPHVFLVGLAEDQLPSFQAKKKGADSHEMQEERRNCFVAITRTIETLTITYAGKYNGWNKRPSRFLKEMGILPV